jgi:AcrR family transcriptional regulator
LNRTQLLVSIKSPAYGDWQAHICTSTLRCHCHLRARYDGSITSITSNVSFVNIVSGDNIMEEAPNNRPEREKPKPYHHGDLRHALIQAGLELLSEGGAAAFDLRKVARKAGVSHAAPYRHFPDKRALVAAINAQGFRQLAEQIQARLREAPDQAFEQLQAIASAYVQFAEAHPWLMREMFSGLTVEHEAFPELSAASKAVFTLYMEVIKQGQGQGSIIEGEPTALSGVLWALLHGVAMLTIEQQMRPATDGPGGTERVTRFSVQLLYEGLGRK